MVESLSYSISERDFDRKVAPYLKKLSKVMKSKLNEYYDFNNKVMTRERSVTHYLYNGTEINTILNEDKKMIITLSSSKDERLINKLERLTKK